MSENSIITRTMPIVCMRGSVVFPHTDSFLSFGRAKSVSAIEAAFHNDKVVAIFNQKDPKIAEPTTDDLYRVGTIATISQMMNAENDIHVMVQGMMRAELKDIIATEPFLTGQVVEITEEEYTGKEVEALSKELVKQFKKIINLGKAVDVPTIYRILSKQADPIEQADSVASLLEIKPKEKQKLLETISVKERLEKVLELLSHELNVLDLEQMISKKTQKRFEDQMRKAMLREKKRTIEKELGDIGEEDDDDDISEYKKKIKLAKMPKDVRKKALKEVNRLSQLSPQNPETGYIRNYLDVLVEMPWSVYSKTNVSVKKSAEILDKDHYALGKAKERILEFLSVMKLKEEELEKAKSKSKKKKDENGSHPTILCFVGPPGVGKTSIGKSIARAMNREFVRMSLGGVRDEAELRGHRRTYVGALPGRIIQGIKNAGTKNPVFMLDEIDKLGADYRGDPASALLEILDPEQNKEFSDHYLEVPFDLSDVMFICTANVLDSIPLPLLDRMEVITFAGYIEEEKFNIAKKYLWPKQIRVHALNEKGLKITDRAIHEIIKHYTREAGVRELERKLATVSRKIARLVAEKKKYPKTIKTTDIKKFLGPIKYRSQIAEKRDEAGMATGLAVTATGGEILFIEVSLMPGKGKLMLTGQLGDVMKESAQAAFTWTKSHWRDLGLPEGFGKKVDVHIHVPQGAIPKDGPSAGIAMTTALVSALTGVPVRRDVGMTGEVTLRGRALEIGGVKEKIVAGHRAGLKKIIVPKDNKKDVLEDVPKYVRADIEFVYADDISKVLENALIKWPIITGGETPKSDYPQAFFAGR